MNTFEDIPIGPRDVVELFENHQGKENAITSGEIAAELGLTDEEVTNPATRELIRDTIREEQIPVAAGNSGYYRIEKHDEFLEYMDSLQNHIEGTRRRQQLVAMAWNRQERGEE